jgi:chaperonin GroES
MAKTKTKTKTKKSGKKSAAGIKIQPLGDRVVVAREEAEEITAGGIVLPDSAKDKPARGKVLSVGDGRLLDNGTRKALQVSKGDRVLFSSYAGEPFKLGDQELLLMHEEDILAVIE